MIMGQADAVAIVGYGGVFPGADGPEQFWTNIVQGVDATTEVPPGRWLLGRAEVFDPAGPRLDKVYSTRGGFVPDLPLECAGLDLDPELLHRLDPVFQLAIITGRAAWSSAQTASLDPDRVGVIFGNIILPTERSSSFSRQIILTNIEADLEIPPTPAQPTDPMNAFPAGLPAALLARALGLRGTAFTLDAACASSLYALKLASDELLSGKADAMLAGGVSRPDPLYTQMGFSQLQALSARGRPAPFDVDGDGLIVGEGAGLFVLKRLDDAISCGDTIHGVIRGIGLSNDLSGDLLAPSSEGQLRAMRAAYERAGWSPWSVDLIECHAAGTPVGDAVEAESLKQLWGPPGEEWSPGQCVLGSVKSNVGHMLTAAGAAGLLKVLLALKHRVLPPTANQTRVSPRLQLDTSPFRILKSPEPWRLRASGEPRRAALSGFGFGGINAHVLIEEWLAPEPNENAAGPAACRLAVPRYGDRMRHPVAIVGMAAHFGPLSGLRAFQERVLGGGDPIAPVCPSHRWGIPPGGVPSRLEVDPDRFAGYYLDAFQLRIDRFRIPPRELAEMLPQQSLMLKVAAEAIQDAGWDTATGLRTGVLVGLGLDQNSNNFQLRWWLAAQAAVWNRTLHLGLSRDELDRWIEQLREGAGPPLTANRTMGSLGGLVASRIAREFRIGGPSFTVSCDETSGTQALQIAADWLDRGELDAAIVGAVDLCGDIRAVLAATLLIGDARPGEGAAALVLKRLGDAVRDGNRVYAVIRDTASATSQSPGLETLHGASRLTDVGCVQDAIGRVGSATGLAAVVKAAISLYQEILPPGQDQTGTQAPATSASAGPLVRQGPKFWLRNRAQGPRRALANVAGLGGTFHQVILEEAEPTEQSSARHEVERAQPLGARNLALFALEAEDHRGLLERACELLDLVESHHDAPIEWLARLWFSRKRIDHRLPLGMAIVAADIRSLRRDLESVRRAWTQGREIEPRLTRDFASSVFPPRFLGFPAKVAFVYPGLGHVFAGMGRALSVLWPEILRAQDSRNGSLSDQFMPELWWNDEVPRRFDDHRPPILGQVAVGSLATDLLAFMGVKPDAAIGYSLGESAALVALHAWTDRDLLMSRLASSSLFATELAGPRHAAARVWGFDPGEPVDWTAGILSYPADLVEAAIKGRSRVYVLIRNSASECVIGGLRTEVLDLVDALSCPFHELGLVSTLHCEIGQAVEQEYRALHDLATAAPEGVLFSSAGWGGFYRPDRNQAADAITALAARPINFPAVIERAYSSDIRVFLEPGPGDSCTRLVRRILGDRPHLASAICLPELDPLRLVLETLGSLIACRVPLDLAPLYGRETLAVGHRGSGEDDLGPADRRITIEVAAKPMRFEGKPAHAAGIEALAMVEGSPGPRATSSALFTQVVKTEEASARAHEAFLRVSHGFAELIGKNMELQLALVEAAANGAAWVEEAQAKADGASPSLVSSRPEVVALDRAQCLAFAGGSIAAVLGPQYAPIDAHPTRVRLPDEPLMLVDRIIAIEGQPRSLSSGRVVTEHEIHTDAWYLDACRIPPSIAIESGQADLFLSGYLGIDFVTGGLAVYRLLDATVTFHRGLPGPGEVIRYDIKITRFFRQGDTHLFRFQFEGTVGGRPLLTMRDGCAGFFTAAELAAGKGIVPRPLEARSRTGVKPPDWTNLVPLEPTSLDDGKVDSLRRGDLGAAFGPPFDGLLLPDPLPLPGGRMTLVHRVETLDPQGGRYALGLIRAELDIYPGDWFMVCHFVDDRVMPGTLMYECCLHTLRIFLMRLGWVGPRGEVAFEPVPGVANRLRCRGQVIESTRRVVCDVSVKELGYDPEPYAIADALMYADGKPIVEITDMALKLTGSSRDHLERIWSGPGKALERSPAPPARLGTRAVGTVVCGKDRILAFATGKPSHCFGDRYRPFDDGRFIARLPGPPYQFLDRIIEVAGEPWAMAEGTWARSEYDIPSDAWYFEADRQDRLPYAVLHEAALQSCGWVAAYMGSALVSSEPLKFRNLGGTAHQHAPLDRWSGTLSTWVKFSRLTRSAGMIIQHYDFTVHCGTSLVLDGSTYFGFFHPDALTEQVGIRDATPYELSPVEQAAARSFPLPDRAPFPDSRWRMIDRIAAMVIDGGPHGLGAIEGTIKVDPDAWFFKAHFLGDPVWPGSLGLESFLQLLKVVAAQRWEEDEAAVFDSPGLDDPHRWVYRGQIVPTHRAVTTQVVITGRDEERRSLKADGWLSVSGKVIYQVNDFTLRLIS
jgi:acyl transferase domain-containing protein/3-hydroxymyristoyl/3-hydroxydecanoyl-(acyl carrier protein) dehydratase